MTPTSAPTQDAPLPAPPASTSTSNPSFTAEQERAWQALNSERNVFLTGEAGSGKSYVIRHFIKDRGPKKTPVLASTGAAAVLIGGRTFHSFWGLGIMEGGPQATVERALKDKRLKKRLSEAETIIVDEVSMLSGVTLATAETIARKVRGSTAPWGGLRIIAVGDFAQLPPVSTSRPSASHRWAFLDPVWETSEFQNVALSRNLRTENRDFLEVLHHVRRGELPPLVQDFLNQRTGAIADEFAGTRLFPLRRQTEDFNLFRLHSLDGQLHSFKTIYSGSPLAVEQLKKHSPLPEELLLKLGALVMLRQNDPKLHYVNGSTGWVRRMTRETLEIELQKGRVVEIEPVTFSYLNAEGEPIAALTNFPVTLAYAATIHKAQGVTLERMAVNLSRLWEPGQAYVALSRSANPEQLQVEQWEPRSILADPQVLSFYDRLTTLNPA